MKHQNVFVDHNPQIVVYKHKFMEMNGLRDLLILALQTTRPVPKQSSNSYKRTFKNKFTILSQNGTLKTKIIVQD